MEKILLNHSQAQALNKLLNNLKADSTIENNYEYYTHLQMALDFSDDALSILEKLHDSIFDTMSQVADKHYAHSISVIEKTPEILKEMHELLDCIENNLARAVKHFGSLSEEYEIKWYLTPQEITEQIYAFAEKFVDYYIEMDDNNDVYLCFYEYNEDTPCFLKDVLVANCQNEDLYYVKDCINKMQYPN